MENNSSTFHSPSNVSIIGWILLTIGFFTELVALAEKARTGLIAGAILTVAGIIFVMIDKYRKKRLVKQQDMAKQGE